MGLFPRLPAPPATARQEHSAVDQLVLEIGQTTDQVMLNALRESRASSNHVGQYLAEQRASDATWWAAHRRQQAEQMERAHPGYWQELNKQRTAAGLPPI